MKLLYRNKIIFLISRVFYIIVNYDVFVDYFVITKQFRNTTYYGGYYR